MASDGRISCLGMLVRHHRSRAGLTQTELADMAGVGKTTVFDIERGKPTVQLRSILPVLRVLNMDLEVTGPFVQECLEKNSV